MLLIFRLYLGAFISEPLPLGEASYQCGHGAEGGVRQERDGGYLIINVRLVHEACLRQSNS